MAVPLRVQMSGPLSGFAAGYRQDLMVRGYGADGATKQLQLMAHLSRWMAAHELQPAALGVLRSSGSWLSGASRIASMSRCGRWSRH